MTRKKDLTVGAVALSALSLCLSGMAFGQSQTGSQSQPPQQQPQQQQPQQQQAAPADKDKEPNPPPMKMDNAAPPPASPEEEAAFKTVQQTTDVPKKIQLSEEFVQKYPQSRYRPAVYQNLVSGYFQTQQIPKMLDAGEKEIALAPNDAPVLALMGQTIARSIDPKGPNAVEQLQKAEQYSKRAIQVTPTLQKPENLTDEAFDNAKSDTLAMAHGGLGLVYIREGKFSDAIPELEESVKVDKHPEPDPVNYYLLGVADKQTSHFDKAAQAFGKCASVQSTLQEKCKSSEQDAKKQGATQLSAPN
jgi:tetratricopeptide (TPR) repeat protein